MQRIAVSLSIAIALAALGCGGGDKQPAPPAEPAQPEKPAPEPPAAQQPAPQPAPQAAAQPPAVPDAAGVVHLTANDQMRYSTTRIEVAAGQKIKIELKNLGNLPKQAMGHNLVVLKPGTDPMAFAAKGAAAQATDYVPQDAKDQIIAATKLLGPGESDTIEFEVPGPGTYPFVCTFPGHAALMNGQLVVQQTS